MDIRQEALDANKRHKSSWLKLGKLLLDISVSKEFTDWGFGDFSEYIKHELGITKKTASDMMTAYEYVKSNEPGVLNTIESTGEAVYVPDYHTICQLQKAHEKDEIGGDVAESLHSKLFDENQDDKEVAKEIRERSKPETNPMDEIRAEVKTIKSLSRRLDNKLHNTSAFENEILEAFELLNQKIQQVEV